MCYSKTTCNKTVNYTATPAWWLSMTKLCDPHVPSSHRFHSFDFLLNVSECGSMPTNAETNPRLEGAEGTPQKWLVQVQHSRRWRDVRHSPNMVAQRLHSADHFTKQKFPTAASDCQMIQDGVTHSAGRCLPQTKLNHPILAVCFGLACVSTGLQHVVGGPLRVDQEIKTLRACSPKQPWNVNAITSVMGRDIPAWIRVVYSKFPYNVLHAWTAE